MHQGCSAPVHGRCKGDSRLGACAQAGGARETTGNSTCRNSIEQRRGFGTINPGNYQHARQLTRRVFGYFPSRPMVLTYRHLSDELAAHFLVCMLVFRELGARRWASVTVASSSALEIRAGAGSWWRVLLGGTHGAGNSRGNGLGKYNVRRGCVFWRP